MSRGKNQKFKLVYLMELMKENTDDEHGLTMPEIVEKLERDYDVTAERKSIYADFTDMTDKLDIEIIKEQEGRKTKYHVGSREFELAEVKLLVDAIQSSKFITKNKSTELINKLKKFVSKYQASALQSQAFINVPVKSMNKSVLFNVDEIYTAIKENKQIMFKYYKWDINKKLIPRRDGKWFEVSPWGLTWMDENYYMIAFDAWDCKVKSYRVDKIKDISLKDEKRIGEKEFKKYDMSNLSKSTFAMYGGTKTRVRIQFENSMCGVFLDRFGEKDINFLPIGDNWSEFSVEVNVSQHFYGWLFGLGTKVRLVSPNSVVEELKEYGKAFMENIGAV
ncbi:Predicted DNA-binding transcriptional regulator YafY, contains an HTH and WYL domains [Acetitomaculum ruminis DSM 5522]|uniref:Predicted DNA-binding transcriptional regulator YafY, contains an HTH and WYL domains n=1 Tax=Acetitomaculum ruminis DSM 5522 TaxID=1120918 RepID=A0A1I1AC72_9FIRM|nr:WYL domain-containing protein [Acetitomaculum ruminis]SFB35082.1 Predicted DNA-binding transcriptional regulator YafY, contains an HTH and WYL domains [Acetitomaculum ruminis DSM 5522]